MRVCLFDIDGTLISSGGAGRAALEAALASEFALPADMGPVSLGGKTDRGITLELFAHHGVRPTTDNCDRFLNAYLRHLPQCLHTRPGMVLPGVARLLEKLAVQTDLALGLLTGNVRRGAAIKLGHFSIEQHFAFGGFGDRHPCRNGVADEALAAAQERAAKPLNARDVWVLGDTVHDVTCARWIGARAIAVATGAADRAALEAAHPDWLFDDLSVDAAQRLDWLE